MATACEEVGPLLTELNPIEAEEEKGVIWDLTKAMDEFYKAVTDGENVDAALDAVEEAANAYDEKCSK